MYAVAAVFDMQMAGGDCIWRLGNVMQRCNSTELICFAHRVIDADCLHTQPVVFIVYASAFLFALVCSHNHCSFSICAHVCRCAYTMCLLVCPSVCLHISAGLSQGFSPSSWLLIYSPSYLPHSPSLHPSHWGFHAPNREIHQHSQLCLQSEPSQS